MNNFMIIKPVKFARTEKGSEMVKRLLSIDLDDIQLLLSEEEIFCVCDQIYHDVEGNGINE